MTKKTTIWAQNSGLVMATHAEWRVVNFSQGHITTHHSTRILHSYQPGFCNMAGALRTSESGIGNKYISGLKLCLLIDSVT